MRSKRPRAGGGKTATGARGMIAQSVADILGRHVRLAVEGIDRMYLNIYVPQLQSERGRRHLPFLSYAPVYRAATEADAPSKRSLWALTRIRKTLSWIRQKVLGLDRLAAAPDCRQATLELGSFCQK